MTRKRKSSNGSSTRKSSTSTARRAEVRAARQRKERMRTIALTTVGILFVALVIFLMGRRALNQPGERIADLGNAHMEAAQAAGVTYNSRPPTSGPHYGQLAAWGIHDEPIDDGFLIHNLEDGGVGIWYDCPDGCPELVTQLESIVETRGEERLLLAPYPDMETGIALTAWNRIDRLDEFDQPRIEKFIKAYRGIDHHK